MIDGSVVELVSVVHNLCMLFDITVDTKPCLAFTAHVLLPGCLQLLEILEIFWNLKTLLEILEISWNLIGTPGNFV